MDNLLLVALNSLNIVVNVSTSLGHPLDESKAKELFKVMHQEGVILDEFEIYDWALSNHWADRYAKELAQLGSKIGQGGRVIIKHKRAWAENALPRWKESAQKMES